MHPPDCPAWEYCDSPQHDVIVPSRVSEILVALAMGGLDTAQVAADTRKVHRRMFQELTPAGCEYYAGHYRGERFRCLSFYEVGVPGDARVGAPPQSVAFNIGEMNAEVRAGLAALDTSVLLAPKDRLRYALALACRVFVAFLTIHPYANGNGHAGRLIVWSILGRYGYWPKRWPVEPRPQDPPYSPLIVECRNGNPEPLERHLLQAIVA